MATHEQFARFAEVPLKVQVEVGRGSIVVRELLSLGVGVAIRLKKPAGENLDVFVGSARVATAEAVRVRGKIGVRILALAEPSRGGRS